jgi:rod shape-determining protein MreD
MSSLQRHHGGWIITGTVVAALLLTMLPLPGWMERFRPEWVALVLIYWCLALPDRVGVGIAWLVGILLDVTRGAILGQNALALALVALLVVHLHQRIRVYPLWQQALTVMMLVAISQVLGLWVRGAVGQSPETWGYWIPSLTSALLWPWVFLVLRDLRRRFQVH